MTSTALMLFRPVRYRLIYFVLSLTVIIPGIYSLVTQGLSLGIDFTGGSHMVWQGEGLTEEKIRETASTAKVEIISVSTQGDRWQITTNPLNTELHGRLVPDDVKELSYETIGPTLGEELVKKTLLSISLASLLILIYVARRFRSIRYGTSAVLAMLHDVAIVLGIFSSMRLEVDTLFVTALLTILSFSVHDTIVVYDRIRELKKKHGYLDFEEIVNRAVVETMSRSLNNSMTIIFMLLALLLMGGETINNFIFALLIGTISGTYSSTFTAAPLLVVWDKLARRLKK